MMNRKHIDCRSSWFTAVVAMVLAMMVGLPVADANPDTVITPTTDTAALAAAILGDSDGITVTNVEYTGHPEAIGIFEDGPFGLAEGLVISTGLVEDMAFDPDENTFASTNHGEPGHPLCEELTGSSNNFDAAVLTIEFDLDEDADGVRFDHVVGTEEYPNFVGGAFNDGFGIFINGVNRALSVDDEPVTVNNFFNTDEVIEWPDNEMNFNGSTPLFTSRAPLTGGSTGNTIEVVVCDAGDPDFDSGGFVTLFDICFGDCDGNSQCGDGILQDGEPCDGELIAPGFEQCPVGYEGAPLCNNDPANPDGDGTCSFNAIPDGCDLNQCHDPALNDCSDNAECINDGPDYQCECDDGYTGDGFDCTRDITIDEPEDGILTNNPRPALNGEGEPGETVTIFVDGNQVGTTTVDTDGRWSYDFDEDLPEGPVTIEVEADSSDASVTIEIDTIPPPLSVEGPDSPTNNNQPTATGSTEPGAQVSVDTGTSTVVVTVNPDGSFEYTPSDELSDGPYTWTFTATDEAGNTTSESVDFVVDTEPPPLTLTGPDSPTNNTSPTVTGTTEPFAEVTVDTGNTTETVTADENGEFSITPESGLSDGSYSWDVTATDEAGNSTTDTADFEIDTVPPSLSVEGPDSPTNNNQPTATGSTDPDAMVSVDTGTSTVVVTVNPDGSFEYTPSDELADGPHTWTFTATDEAGNTTSQSVDFVVDTEPPPLSVDGPDDPTNDNQPTATGSTETGATVVIDTGDGTETLEVDEDGNFSYTPSDELDDGSYSWTFTATDEAGNETTETVDFVVDTEPPHLEVLTPSEGPTTDNQPEVSGTADPHATVEIDTGDEVVTVEADEDGNWSWTPEDELDDGEYSWEVSTRDEAGNETSELVEFEVDTVAPMVLIRVPDDNAVLTSSPETIEGEAEEEVEIFVRIYEIDPDTGEPVGSEPIFEGTVDADADGNWEIDIDDELEDGHYRARATATDAAGNSAEDDVDFIVDTTDMVIITSPGSDDVVRTAEPTVSGQAEPGEEVTIYVDGEPVGTVEADEDGNWSWTPDEPFDDGEVTITARTDSPAGDREDSVTFEIDTSTTDVAIESPQDGDVIGDGRPTISGSAAPGATVTIYVDGEEVGQTTADENGQWSFSPDEPIEDGERFIAAVADDDGIESEDIIDITIDTEPPMLLVEHPDDGQVFAFGSAILVQGSTSQDAEVEIFLDEQSMGHPGVTSDGDFELDLPDDLEPGDYDLRTTATDEAGNRAVDERIFSIEDEDSPIVEDDPDGYLSGGAACTTTPGSGSGLVLFFAALLMLVGRVRRRFTDETS